MKNKLYSSRARTIASGTLLRAAFAISLFLVSIQGFALKGAIGSHDPSALIRDGSKYWMFTTGDGIYAAYSTDLISWTSGPKTVFPIGTWPSWINNYVPNFAGNFWAPDCIYMNGKYYLYYSCSTFGSSSSAIGVATSPTLDQGSPNYVWTDLGVVVSSNSSSQINAIDPGLFKDSNGNVYMTYGSFSNGIGVVRIDPATGKVYSGASVVKVAGGGGSDWEAPYLIREGSYYYLFVNRGLCCKGANSTYRIVVGRSTSPTGPFVDASGVNLNSNGGTQVLGTSGRFIGPGHFGLLRENGSNFVSIHFYDGADNGNPKLDIINMGFSGGWPFLTRDWIAAGLYQVKNKNSNLVWDAWGCTGASGQRIAQGTWSGLSCQKWTFTPVGDGYYRITCNLGGLSADIVNCGSVNSTPIQLYQWLNNNCQKFEVERAADGSHVFTPANTSRVVEVPGASLTAGTGLALWDYNGHNTQRWLITSTTAAREATSDFTVQFYPNPAKPSATSRLEILDKEKVITGDFTYRIFDNFGKLVHSGTARSNSEIAIPEFAKKGLYIIQVHSPQGTLKTQRLIIEE